jgi:hypothetical protein
MNRVTPRVPINKNLYDLIGRTLNSNCFPTMRGRMIFVKEDRCYFEMLENENFTKYKYAFYSHDNSAVSTGNPRKI